MTSLYHRACLLTLAGLAAGFLAGTHVGEAVAADCGADVPCTVASGNYRIQLPPGETRGALLFFHGYKGSAEAEMKAAGLIKVAAAHGLAFVAADGLDGTWAHRNAPAASDPDHRDETRFAGEIIADIESRFDIPANKVIVAGFSQGASMAYDVVCNLGDRIGGAVVFSGAFWNPLPVAANCPAEPPPLVHVHGTADRTFPLEGRAIGTRWHQGSTPKTQAILAERAGCKAPAVAETIGALTCTTRVGCGQGSDGFLALCLHDGGHRIEPQWLDAALRRLEAAGKDH